MRKANPSIGRSVDWLVGRQRICPMIHMEHVLAHLAVFIFCLFRDFICYLMSDDILTVFMDSLDTNYRISLSHER